MKSRNWIWKCLVLLLVSFVCVNRLSAEWDPEEVLSMYDRREIQNQNFGTLKGDISRYLAGSWCSQEKISLLMDLVLVTRPRNCVEVGVFTGSSVLPVAATLQYLKKGTIYAIDAWSNEEVVRALDPSDPNVAWWSKVDMKDAFETFKTMVRSRNLQESCRIIERPSHKAVGKLPKSIDFLHLDGGFSEKASCSDVEQYLPRVKRGGYILASNLFFTVSGQHLKKKSFQTLYDRCDLLCEIDDGETILFKKR